MDGPLLGESVDGNVNDEAAAFQIQSDGPSQWRMWRARQYHHFSPRAVGCPLRAALPALGSSASPYDDCTCADEGNYRRSECPIPRNPVLGSLQVAKMEDWRRETADGGERRFDGLGDPWGLLEGLADGCGDGVEVAFDGVGEARRVVGYFLGVAPHVVGDGGELRRC